MDRARYKSRFGSERSVGGQAIAVQREHCAEREHLAERHGFMDERR